MTVSGWSGEKVGPAPPSWWPAFFAAPVRVALSSAVVLPVLALVGFSPVAVLQGQDAQGSAPATVVRVTEPGFRGPAELSVAINPADPDNIVIVSLAAGPPGGPGTTNYAYVTRDGGESWTTVLHPNPDRRTQGDDAVTFDAQGNAYHSYISFEGIRVARPQRAWNGIFVSRSADGGVTWDDPVPVVDHINTVEPFEDKPWLATDKQSGSPHFGNLYVAWTRFDIYGSENPNDSTQIFFSRSILSLRVGLAMSSIFKVTPISAKLL